MKHKIEGCVHRPSFLPVMLGRATGKMEIKVRAEKP